MAGPLPMGSEMCVSRVVDCSSLVLHGKFPLCWEIYLAWYLPMFLVLGAFTFSPVLSLGGCKFIWVVALTVFAAMYCFSVCGWFLHHIHCRAFVILLNGSIVHCV